MMGFDTRRRDSPFASRALQILTRHPPTDARYRILHVIAHVPTHTGSVLQPRRCGRSTSRSWGPSRNFDFDVSGHENFPQIRIFQQFSRLSPHNRHAPLTPRALLCPSPPSPPIQRALPLLGGLVSSAGSQSEVLRAAGAATAGWSENTQAHDHATFARLRRALGRSPPPTSGRAPDLLPQQQVRAYRSPRVFLA